MPARAEAGDWRNAPTFNEFTRHRRHTGSRPVLVALQVLTVVFVAVAMALSLAHALELPGKLRLSKQQYLDTQLIYYPGFAIGGIAEPVGLVMLLLLMLSTTARTAFWLTAAAFACLLAMHAAYWLLTHPVNQFWLKDFKLHAPGARFFALDPLQRTRDERQPDWVRLRDRWEYSHVLRAVLGLLTLVLLVTAVAV
jgi:hypothetical protein